MTKLSFAAALLGAAVVGAVAAVVVQPLVAPTGEMQEPAVSQAVPAPEEKTAAAVAAAEETAAAAMDKEAPATTAEPASAEADEAAMVAEEGDVVAIVNGQNIYESDLLAFIQNLPPQQRRQVQMLMPQILDQLVNNALTTEAGRAAGLADDADVQRRVAKIEDLIVGQTYLQRAIEARVTEEKREAAYQKFLEENPPKRQLRARHILVKTEEEAKEVIVALDGGADFATLAKERSTGPSGPNGGELPPFQIGQMVPEFSDAAFAMEVGSYSKEPVQTQFGFHVILLEDSSMTEPPAKSEVAQQLDEQLDQAAVLEVQEELRVGAAVEILFGKSAADATPEGGGEADPDAGDPAATPKVLPEGTPEGGGGRSRHQQLDRNKPA